MGFNVYIQHSRKGAQHVGFSQDRFLCIGCFFNSTCLRKSSRDTKREESLRRNKLNLLKRQTAIAVRRIEKIQEKHLAFSNEIPARWTPEDLL